MGKIKYNVDNGTGNKLYVPCKHTCYTDIVFSIYENFNKCNFDDVVICPQQLKDFVDCVYRAHGQSYDKFIDKKTDFYKVVDGIDYSKICLGFSGGLDSMYHAFALRDMGIDVVLFHVKGINTYENGQGTKCCRSFATKYGFKYVEAVISKAIDKDNPYRQYWPENPIKNQLILAMMMDWCEENDCSYIALGDDFELSINDAVVGINLTDSRELTLSFLSCMDKIVCGYGFIGIEKCIDKSQRLSLLKEKGALNDYYSCVLPGRFNRMRHDANEKKFDVSLPFNNCGCSCRKCAMHNLIMYYSKMVDYPQDFIDACWKIMWDNSHSADYKFFSPNIPLENRIKNLFTY